MLAELGGADQITIHLREDRRHIQDRDLPLLRASVATRLNLEAAAAPAMVAIVIAARPDQVTFVPDGGQCGFEVAQTWTDSRERFADVLLRA